MGRKRKRARKVDNEAWTTKHGGPWPDAIVEELLAYIDSGVAFLDPETKAEVERKYEDVDNEISQHLNAVNEEGNYSPRQFSSAQVGNKLHQLWRTHGREGYKPTDWKIIYRRGSSCLMGGKDPELANRVARRSGIIKMMWMERYLTSPRKTRARSLISRESHLTPQRLTSASPPTPVAQSRLSGNRVGGQHPLRQRRPTSDHDNVRLGP